MFIEAVCATRSTIINSENLKVHPRMKELYKFFKYNGKVVDITNYNPNILNIFSRKVLGMIANGEEGWQQMLPKGIVLVLYMLKIYF